MPSFFKRYEKKYIMDTVQYELLMHFTEGKIVEDTRTGYTIKNLYYDTDDYELIRASIQKPVYKEKLRLRTYHDMSMDQEAYIELKKKVEGIVYKRRLKTTVLNGIAFLGGGPVPNVSPESRFTMDELQHFLGKYDVKPKALISYDRQCLHGISDPDFRLTFDSDLTYESLDNTYELLLRNNVPRPIIEPDKIVMEIKTPTAIPVWLSKIMSELDIYPTSFSKYGEAYKTYICGNVFANRVETANADEAEKKEVGLSA